MSRQPKFLQHTTSNIVNSSTSKGRVHTGMNDLAVRAPTWVQEAGMASHKWPMWPWIDLDPTHQGEGVGSERVLI